MKFKLLFQLSTFAFLGIGMSNCGSNLAKENDANTNSIAVRLAQVETQVINRPILASGLVASASEARLAFKTGGVIDRILVKEGQTVVRGQLLATLNLTEISAQVNQAKEGVAKAERDLNRVKNLYADSVVSKCQYCLYRSPTKFKNCFIQSKLLRNSLPAYRQSVAKNGQ